MLISARRCNIMYIFIFAVSSIISWNAWGETLESYEGAREKINDDRLKDMLDKHHAVIELFQTINHEKIVNDKIGTQISDCVKCNSNCDKEKYKYSITAVNQVASQGYISSADTDNKTLLPHTFTSEETRNIILRSHSFTHEMENVIHGCSDPYLIEVTIEKDLALYLMCLSDINDKLLGVYKKEGSGWRNIINKRPRP